MTQYILRVSSYKDLVPWARHFKGMVEGEHPESCHGSTHFNAPGSRGKTTCDEGHEIPERVRWDVERELSESARERYLAACRVALRKDEPSPDGPGQFDSEREVIDRAVIQFLDGLEGINDPAVDGDELWFGFVDPDGGMAEEFWDDPEEVWGMMLARCSRG